MVNGKFKDLLYSTLQVSKNKCMLKYDYGSSLVFTTTCDMDIRTVLAHSLIHPFPRLRRN